MSRYFRCPDFVRDDPEWEVDPITGVAYHPHLRSTRCFEVNEAQPTTPPTPSLPHRDTPLTLKEEILEASNGVFVRDKTGRRAD